MNKATKETVLSMLGNSIDGLNEYVQQTERFLAREKSIDADYRARKEDELKEMKAKLVMRKLARLDIEGTSTIDL